MASAVVVAEDTESALIARAQLALSHCNWEVGECAAQWTKRFARGRTDADFGALVGGSALLTEVVFNIHGVGKLTFDSLQNFDLPVIMATVIYASFFVVVANAIVDVVYALIDPRVRHA